MLKKEIDDLRA